MMFHDNPRRSVPDPRQPYRDNLQRCEAILRAGRRLSDRDRKIVLNSRVNLIRLGADMAHVALAFPLLDRSLSCDAQGKPVWNEI